MRLAFVATGVTLAAILVAAFVSGILPRVLPPGQFCLLYVYEANTHADAGDSTVHPTALPSFLADRRGEDRIAVSVEGDCLLVGPGRLPSRLTSLCVVRETCFAGATSRLGMDQTVSTHYVGHVGRQGAEGGAALFDDRLEVVVSAPDGTVRVRVAGMEREIPPGKGWGVVAVRREGGIEVFEETAATAGRVRSVSEGTEPASRLAFYNYGRWDLSRVRRAGA